MGGDDAPPLGVLYRYPLLVADSGRGRLTVIRVALDAMGGDDAPRVEVEGAVQALREFPPTLRIQLVGRTRDIEAALKTHGAVDGERLESVESTEVVGRGEKTMVGVKRKHIN